MSAQEREVIKGEARDVIGEIAGLIPMGRWAEDGVVGWRIGDMKTGHFRVAIEASELTIWVWLGQTTFGEMLLGRVWIYSGVYFKMKSEYACGKQSRSKTNACRSWLCERANSIHEPNHQGGLISLTAARPLYKNSSDRAPV